MFTDPSQHLGATVREVRHLEYRGQRARAVVAVRAYTTTRDDLWDALTNGERIPRWFLPISGELRVGGRYQFQGNAGGLIETCDAPTSLSVTWEYGAQITWVRVTLHVVNEESTRLELEHIAPVTDEGEAFWTRYGPGAVGVGWDLGLTGLERHVDTGADNDGKAAEAWTLSPEGQAFVKQCSDGWGAASIAAGTEKQAALKAAAHTFAFYTGQPEPE
ncbi:MAG TPA: SRPBCC domain-containing protein [Gemmatimonas sp.]|uniref:SRPBCC domain-containing protein n=1 Tax=Gemmatimonas sp. TaxID=1962908 RepID=UPI002ED97343